jgi:heme oxygenase (biliverdin-IX-beta and delta-forming)
MSILNSDTNTAKNHSIKLHIKPQAPSQIKSNSPQQIGIVVRGLLREATKYNHPLLNHHPLLLGLADPHYPLDRYRELLRAYLQVYEPLESSICNFLSVNPAIFNYKERMKTTWLLSDLNYFNDLPLRTPLAMKVPAINNLGELIGVLYVVEGATLGGQLISKCLANYHGLSREQGACFFNGYGELTPSKWLEFIRFSDCIYNNEFQIKAAETAANRTFIFFERILDEFKMEATA